MKKQKITIWYETDKFGSLGRLDFKAYHLSSTHFEDGRALIVFFDKKWRTQRVEQLYKVRRISNIH